jgi:hypothetical protein
MNTLNRCGHDVSPSSALGQHDTSLARIGTLLAYSTGGMRYTAPGFHHSNM